MCPMQHKWLKSNASFILKLGTLQIINLLNISITYGEFQKYVLKGDIRSTTKKDKLSINLNIMAEL